MTNIWWMVPEILSTTNIWSFWSIFLPFYPHNNPKNQNFENMKKPPGDIIILHVSHKWQPYDVWFLRYGVWQTDFFVILDGFLPFYPPNILKNQNFEKLKKTPGYIIILHMCSINQHFKKMRRTSEYTFILHKCTRNHDHMPYILFLRYGAWQV